MEPRRAADLMRRNVIALAPDDTLGSVGEMMRLARIRQLPVVDGECVVGELSYRDACGAYRELFERPAPRGRRRRGARRLASLPVQQVMRPPGDVVGPRASLGEVAERIARRGAGFVPVVEEGASRRLLGVVTERDLLLAALEARLS